MDITDVILFQHHRQREMFAQIDDVDRHDVETLGALWTELSTFLEVHAAAEEAYFYPRLLEIGTGGGGEDSAASETKDAIKDHNEIRDAIAEAAKHDVGTDPWWSAVMAARVENSDHMAEEEREDLADFRQHADLQTRHDLAVDFLSYLAHHAGGVPTQDKDPDDYVESPA